MWFSVSSMTSYSRVCRFPRNSDSAWYRWPTATGPGVSLSITGVLGSHLLVLSNSCTRGKPEGRGILQGVSNMSVDRHREIVDAIDTGDAALARKTILAHMDTAAANLVS